ncbi:MAG: diguanylate cyclase [Candidatus Binatia bacterium]
MDAALIRVLLIDDDEDDYVVTRNLLAQIEEKRFSLKWVASYEPALEELEQRQYDICLLDYQLGKRDGLELLHEIYLRGCSIPIIFLTGQGDRTVDLAAMEAGAVDYLVKGQVTASLLERSLRYALEQHRLKEELRRLTLVDPLTGLYNRRGFLPLAEQQLKVATRANREGLMVCADLDGLKQINDTFGHEAGDLALSGAAEVLKKTFRISDIIARLGGDEFAVFAVEATQHSAETLLSRLQHHLNDYNARHSHPFILSLSTGTAVARSTSTASVEELMAAADQALYVQKRARKALGLKVLKSVSAVPPSNKTKP